ncbi:hypothetical protein K1719_040150 [Acacia pycnantha]|nr:hypothetical protein K1719_040150 [Acacia pycnantha]
MFHILMVVVVDGLKIQYYFRYISRQPFSTTFPPPTSFSRGECHFAQNDKLFVHQTKQHHLQPLVGLIQPDWNYRGLWKTQIQRCETIFYVKPCTHL